MGNYDARVFEGVLGGISATVATLPSGFVLGEERQEAGIKYRLMYNAAANSVISPGQVASPQPLNGGIYSLTISAASKTYANMGAAACHHATIATGYYGWMVVRGYLASGLIATGVCLATGYAFYVGEGGSVTGITPNSTLVSANVIAGYVINGAAAGTVGVRQGSVIVAFE